MAFSSQDGLPSLVEFQDGELRSLYCLSKGNVSDKDSKNMLQTTNNTVLPTGNVCAVVAEKQKIEVEYKTDDMIRKGVATILDNYKTMIFVEAPKFTVLDNLQFQLKPAQGHGLINHEAASQIAPSQRDHLVNHLLTVRKCLQKGTIHSCTRQVEIGKS